MPLPISASSTSLPFPFRTRGEAVDAVTPAGLPQEPSPFEEDKLIYATTGTASSGPWRWISAGSCGRLRSLLLLPRASRSRPRGPHEVLPLRYVDDYLFRGPPCGHMAAMKVSSCSPLRTSSSPLCLTEKCTTDLRRTRVRVTGVFFKSPRAIYVENGLSLMVGCPVL